MCLRLFIASRALPFSIAMLVVIGFDADASVRASFLPKENLRSPAIDHYALLHTDHYCNSELRLSRPVDNCSLVGCLSRKKAVLSPRYMSQSWSKRRSQDNPIIHSLMADRLGLELNFLWPEPYSSVLVEMPCSTLIPFVAESESWSLERTVKTVISTIRRRNYLWFFDCLRFSRRIGVYELPESFLFSSYDCLASALSSVDKAMRFMDFNLRLYSEFHGSDVSAIRDDSA